MKTKTKTATSLSGMQINNHRETLASYSKQGREAKERRAAELSEGSPLTDAEQAARLESSIEADEKRLGFDGYFGNEPQVRGVMGTTAHNAFQPATIKELIY